MRDMDGNGMPTVKAAKSEKKPHILEINERARMRLCGVEEVRSFDEKSIVLVSTQGSMVIEGDGLRITVWNTEQGNMELTGRIDGLYYYVPRETGDKKSGWRRLFH